MTCSNINQLKIIPVLYDELNAKKIFKNFLSNINKNTNKKIHLFYYKNSDLPICALPKLKIVVISRKTFLSFCYTFYLFISSFNTKDIVISKENIYTIAKCALHHEVGHILDPEISTLKYNYKDILLSICDIIYKYNIDLEDNFYYKDNLPIELEELIINFKRNVTTREMNAWNIGASLMDFESDTERYIFNKIKEFALATYNYGNLKNIVIDHNLKNFIKTFY